ncbi:MAG: sortase [Clostridia bacterium]|jgi:sortase A|nr:sortase [Clostridia bacterium]
MKKGKFPIVLVLGIALIVISFSMIVVLNVRSYIGADKSRSVIETMQELLPERSEGIPEIYADPSMPVLQIDGVDYVALLEIRSLGALLPIADKWDSDKLFVSPARFCGSVYDHTLVIGGVDSTGQFDFCDKIDNGTLVTVTDMTGTQFTYTVERVDRSKKAENEWLTGTEYDLTLYCRDNYSMEYIAVRCNFVYN